MKRVSVGDDILYEDNHLIVINKKPSQIVQGDKTGDLPLSDIIKEVIRKRDNKPGKVFLGVVHRIDRPVSGIVLFAKTSKALARLNQMFRDGNIRKTYWAVVKNPPPETRGHLIHFLKKNEEKNKSFAFDKEMKDTLKAEMIYTLIGRSDKYFLLEIILLTGRHHQIRSQLSKIGCPVKGDLKYGADRPNPDGSIHLHARKVEFTHPVSREEIRIVADPPEDKLWELFLNQDKTNNV